MAIALSELKMFISYTKGPFWLYVWNVVVAWMNNCIYRQTHNTSHALLGNKIVDHSNGVGASPIRAALSTS